MTKARADRTVALALLTTRFPAISWADAKRLRLHEFNALIEFIEQEARRKAAS